MAEGFLSRWSRRKADVREGKAVEEGAVEVPASGVESASLPSPQPSPGGRGSQAGSGRLEADPAERSPHLLPLPPGEGGGEGAFVQAPSSRYQVSLPLPAGEGRGEATTAQIPPEIAQPPAPPTLDDVRLLTRESDFSRFAARDVAPDVKNAAMKKLFSDPHFNVMDRLDVYIDDYSKPDPVPESVLRKLATAKFLGLFKDEEEEAKAEALPREVANDPPPQTVAQSDTAPQAVAPPAVPEPPAHADPDLRLQQDDAPAGEDPGDIAR